jgi:tRNA dimethylallyltransferase
MPLNHPALKAVGVRELKAVLDGTMKLGEAIESAQTQSRNYAKRQYTWFKNRFMAKARNAGMGVEIF